MWREGPTREIDTVIVDIDGVLANASHRQGFLRGETPDWGRFYEGGIDDDPIDASIAVLSMLRSDVTVALVSARPMWAQSDTVSWLIQHAVRWDLLVMRELGSGLDAPSFKRRSVTELRTAGFAPVLAFDDDPRNVAMYGEMNVPCVYVHSGYYGLDHL